MPKLLKLERDMETFFQTWNAPKAKKLFLDAIDCKARQLLTDKVAYAGIDMKWLASTEIYKLEPRFTLEASELWNRAFRAKMPKVSDRAIDVRKVLREQVRLARVQGKVRNFRRII
jgi:hypothetical protein